MNPPGTGSAAFRAWICPWIPGVGADREKSLRLAGGRRIRPYSPWEGHLCGGDLCQYRPGRAAETAELVADAYHISIEQKPCLRELDKGSLTGLPREKAEMLFINFWLYSHGIATQIVSNDIDIPLDLVKKLLKNAFNRFSLETV